MKVRSFEYIKHFIKSNDKSKVKEVLDGDISIKSHESGGKANKKLEYKKIKCDPHGMLIAILTGC